MVRVRARLGRLRRGFGPRNRHRLRAGVRGRLRRRALSRRLSRWRADERDRPILGVALIEHLGDLVAAEPIARHLRRTRPDARIVWLVRPVYRPLVAAFADVDATFDVGCLTEWRGLRETAASAFDELFDLHLHGRSCAVCRERLDRPPDRRDATIENYYDVGNLLHAFCRAGGLPVLDERPTLVPPADVAAIVAGLELPESYVVVHGRSNQAVRDWTDAAWRRLAGRIVAELGMSVVEIGSEPVLDAKGPGVVDLTARTSILASAEVIRRSELFIGIDSGPAHLANAVATPAVLLLGRYREFDAHMPYSGPWARGEGGAHILRSPERTAAIDPDRVFDAVRAAMPAAVPEASR